MQYSLGGIVTLIMLAIENSQIEYSIFY